MASHRAQAYGALNLEHYKRIVQTAERGKFDAMFLADNLAANFDVNLSIGRGEKSAGFEPVTLFLSLSMITSRIRFIANASTTYEDPYQLARKFASLDYLSNGRAGWNVVTFVDIVKALWDNWEDDALIRDKVGRHIYRPEQGPCAQSQRQILPGSGPLNIARPPQGYPVIVHAGQSEPGKELAARIAEVIFTAQQSLADAQAFYAGIL
ncbi:LLM class flavin-dependent oxidoreductase [Candidatus Methylospira mobilis]|uniref:LLM class flavin-dependent oxidoreductase n=1 Tax=Candidatus Methylospira mobilis TaxID=1808979 RepID=UPI001D176A37|nr:LLM class flavin-dependent oxidoreductase [Candidatus Methylospira mobilis]WNV06853.1 LLM class flavin-dependent oxidoreductase [Candidatus Methylospira mobilis]